MMWVSSALNYAVVPSSIKQVSFGKVNSTSTNDT